jgi:hypothetical protein
LALKSNYLSALGWMIGVEIIRRSTATGLGCFDFGIRAG